MKRYVYRIWQDLGRGRIEDQSVWTAARSEQEARRCIKGEYWRIVKMVLLRTERYDGG